MIKKILLIMLAYFCYVNLIYYIPVFRGHMVTSFKFESDGVPSLWIRGFAYGIPFYLEQCNYKSPPDIVKYRLTGFSFPTPYKNWRKETFNNKEFYVYEVSQLTTIPGSYLTYYGVDSVKIFLSTKNGQLYIQTSPSLSFRSAAYTIESDLSKESPNYVGNFIEMRDYILQKPNSLFWQLNREK